MKKLLIMLLVLVLSVPALVSAAEEKKDPLAAWQPNLPVCGVAFSSPQTTTLGELKR